VKREERRETFSLFKVGGYEKEKPIEKSRIGQSKG
jgi:hypothetical protein